MKKFSQMLMVAMVATTGTTYAQYAGDAIKFGNTNYGSSTRFKGMGNAQIGVGGDMSSLSGNPAGLGLFTRSEFSFSPELNNSTSKANYLNNNTNDSRTKVNVNQAGVVWYNPTYKPQGQNTSKGVLSTVFGIGFSRTNDFTQQYNYGGSNANTSMRDFFAEEANRNMYSDGSLDEVSLENYAYSDYLINKNTPTSPGRFESTPFSTNVQSQSAIISGGSSEINFAGALNISNQLYIGASIGMVNVRYDRIATYTEKGQVNVYNNGNPNDPNDIPGYAGPEDYSFNYTQNQETQGSGINAKLGIIYRPVSNFRIGLNYQTPTWLYIEDQYSENLFTSLSGEKPIVGDAISSLYNYRLRTPSKASVGASYVFGGQAILSADVDFIDYAGTRFSMDGGGMNDQTIINNNADIKNGYTSAVNYRVGGEYRINNFNLRAGYGLNGSPVKNDTDNTYETQYYSGGLGYRINEYYIDIAYQRVQSKERLSSYTLNNGSEPVATIKNANNNVFLTFGVRF
ncbi:hypothetical protein [Pedobacter nyackensis]|uniref:OmpP1/FadL family transporter n=1 Tax=Pedobacter nyackensis TaxID=475255 RepID=UPI002931E3FC|nr:hypothetical protein [Pedobacter nyackensis]